MILALTDPARAVTFCPLRAVYDPRPATILVLVYARSSVVPRRASLFSTNTMTRREIYEAHLRSDLWQQQRKGAFNRWGRFCNCCGADDAIHVHHLNYRNLVDCLDEDLMPLCEACHNKVHAIPELDEMARVHGDPMAKRRMVIVRISQQNHVLVIEPITHSHRPVLSAKHEKREKKLATKMRRSEKRRLKRERQILARLYPKRVCHTKPLRQDELLVISRRYRVDESAFAGWTNDELRAIYQHEACPIFARPAMALEIAATPPNEMMVITHADVDALRTDKNGFTGQTLKSLGLQWKTLEKGWTERLVGTSMPRVQYLRAVANKTLYAGVAKSISV